jgi:hypothetical protein
VDPAGHGTSLQVDLRLPAGIHVGPTQPVWLYYCQKYSVASFSRGCVAPTGHTRITDGVKDSPGAMPVPQLVEISE